MNEGFISLHRKILYSDFWNTSTPCTREVLIWLLLEANHSDRESKGRMINRGQTFRTRQQIADGLQWKVGYRTGKYTTRQIDTALKHLIQHGIIVIDETDQQGRNNKIRGLMITMCNYKYYQNADNFRPGAKSQRTAKRKETRTSRTKSNETQNPQAFEDTLQTTHVNMDVERSTDLCNTRNNNANNDNKILEERENKHRKIKVPFTESEKIRFTVNKRTAYSKMLNWSYNENPNVVAKMKFFSINEFVKQTEKYSFDKIKTIIGNIEQYYKGETNIKLNTVFTEFAKNRDKLERNW